MPGKLQCFIPIHMRNSQEVSNFDRTVHINENAVKANKLGIGKIWVGITRDGKEIQGNKHMIHSQIWKLSKGIFMLKTDFS